MSRMAGLISRYNISFIDPTFRTATNVAPNNYVRAILVPHAGLRYSGEVARWAWSQVNWDLIDNVLMLSTSHYADKNYIPLTTELDVNGVHYNLDNMGLNLPQNDEAFRSEHSWLVQIPWINPSKPITIILVRTHADLIPLINEKMNHTITDRTLICVNTDLMHCTVGRECPADIESANMQTIDAIRTGKKLARGQLCGTGAVELFRHITKYRNMRCFGQYYNSSDKIDANATRSVGYASLVYKYVMALTSIPRKYIEWHFNTINPSADKFAAEYDLPRCVAGAEGYGIFVTIYKHNRLRGCIGTFERLSQIGYAIAKQTHMAGFHDYRFPPLSNSDGLRFTVTFLWGLVTIDPTYENVRHKLHVGQHGILMEFANGARATFLASVLPRSLGITHLGATEWEHLVEALRRKCGGRGRIVNIQIYECNEFDEHATDAVVLEKIKTRIRNEYTGGSCSSRVGVFTSKSHVVACDQKKNQIAPRWKLKRPVASAACRKEVK